MIMVKVDKCSGCRTCELICSFYHLGIYAPRYSRIKVKFKGGVTENILICRQCKQCIEKCETDAIYFDSKTGAIKIDENKCNGCRACVEACPFGAMFFDEKKNVAYTCDLCGGDPQCVKKCPEKALIVV
ncbi:MAG: 4Fe-4S dicluster domain-containing protein [Candidatus Njordarchaeota archaeon]